MLCPVIVTHDMSLCIDICRSKFRHRQARPPCATIRDRRPPGRGYCRGGQFRPAPLPGASLSRPLVLLPNQIEPLERVRRVLRLGAYVRVGAEGSDAMSSVIDTASSVFEIAFGDAGRHARSVLGVADLPRHSVVMIDLVAAVAD